MPLKEGKTYPLTNLKGVGPKTSSALSNMGIESIIDSVFYLPSKAAIVCGDLIPSAEHPARADFPTGALNDLLSSLERIQKLEPKMLICGRGKAISGLESCKAVLVKHIESVRERIDCKGALPDGWPKPAETCHWLTPQPEWNFD